MGTGWKGEIPAVIHAFEPAYDPATNDDARLHVLAEHQPDSLVDDAELRAITDFAAKLCGTEIALVSLVEADRQRFLARAGLSATETPRSASFCQHAMVEDSVMTVEDATADARFADNALVTGGPHIRFYAGAPLRSVEGAPLGSLCVIDSAPRPGGLSALQRDGLLVLAQAVMRRLEDRRGRTLAERELTASVKRFETLADAMPQMAWSTPEDGQTDYFNARWYEFTGAEPGAHFGSGWVEAVHPEDRGPAADAWQHAVTTGSPYEIEYRLRRHDGEYRWTLARGLPLRDDVSGLNRWFGTNTDIHENKGLAESQELLTRELTHRIKNIFSVVAGLIGFEARGAPEFRPIADNVMKRIAALGRAHEFVRPDDGGAGIDLQRLLAKLFAPYADASGARIHVTGGAMPVADHATTPLALIFHELATNSVKYGALSVDDGHVDLSIRQAGDDVLFRWQDIGGPALTPAVAERNGKGFGTTLVDLSVTRNLKGRIERAYPPEGARIELGVPMGSLR